MVVVAESRFMGERHFGSESARERPCNYHVGPAEVSGHWTELV